jgi:hypothetical protein
MSGLLGEDQPPAEERQGSTANPHYAVKDTHALLLHGISQ